MLTELLLSKLENASTGARIVNVSSKLHLNADCANVEKMNSKKDYGMFQAYARSKLANVVHAVEMTKRLRRLNSGTKVTINSCHPGAVDTNLVRFPVNFKISIKLLKNAFSFSKASSKKHSTHSFGSSSRLIKTAHKLHCFWLCQRKLVVFLDVISGKLICVWIISFC